MQYTHHTVSPIFTQLALCSGILFLSFSPAAERRLHEQSPDGVASTRGIEVLLASRACSAMDTVCTRSCLSSLLASITQPGLWGRFARVLRRQHPDSFIWHIHVHQPATAADVPVELCHMILKFLSLGTCYKTRVPRYKARGQIQPSHDCKDETECTQRYVGCDWQELCRIALVCKQWYRLLQDELTMAIELREHGDLKVILANLDSVHRYTNARRISGEPDLIEHLRTPWIHQISLRILPALNISAKSVELEMHNSGPFPRGQIVSSIHKALPRSLPHFSSGVRTLNLRDVHFKKFDHLVRLIKEMPSVRHVYLTRVTWDPQSLDRDQGLPPTSFLQREDPAQGVGYMLEDCTEVRGALWLAICVGLTREDVLDQNDARLLWAIVLAWRGFKGTVQGRRDEIDEINLYPFHVFLTPRAGVRHKRRVRAIVVELWDGDWSLFDWEEIDRRLASLGALEVVLLVFWSYDSLYGSSSYFAETSGSGIKYLVYDSLYLNLFVHASLGPRPRAPAATASQPLPWTNHALLTQRAIIQSPFHSFSASVSPSSIQSTFAQRFIKIFSPAMRLVRHRDDAWSVTHDHKQAVPQRLPRQMDMPRGMGPPSLLPKPFSRQIITAERY
ncbi:hypothetical protein NM688_g5966 [Phlebia brevispora]|uniref:Uncharacterized protein n=1 Tax=Phlebia brevispora TaxID=194682 RepID=A0ACC1SLW9_9APHY|nr:hypothetical protein NM688_g5966 [Phlebia brevispora]